MSNISRRINAIEKQLNVGKERVDPRVITLFSANSEAEKALPENVEEWLTYKEQLQKCPNTRLVILYAWEELQARGKIQKATESNKKAKNE